MNNETIDFDWTSAEADLPADLLDRSKYAKFLSSFLASKGKEENFVLNINASWGAGKTWFLKRWAEEIKNTHPVVFIDAWKSDHSKDPFLAVISAIVNDLEKMVDPRRVESSLTKKSWLLMKSIAPEVTKGIIKKYLGADCDEISRAIEEDDENILASIGSKIVGDLIKVHDKTNNTIDEFKVAISSYLQCIEAEKKLCLPLFIFIDELDRCRPTYAIEMLETIKHIFDMKKVVFIVATDKSQLQHSIKAVYGSGFNSSKYLDRFFDRTVALQQKSNELFINDKISSSGALEKVISSNVPNSWLYGDGEGNKKIHINLLVRVSHVFEMDLRTISQWIDRLDASLSNNPVGIDVFYLSFLLAANCVDQSMYNDIVTRKYAEKPNGNIKNYIYNDRMESSVLIPIELNCKVMGEFVSVKDDVYQIPWRETVKVNFDVFNIFDIFDDSLEVSQFENISMKLYDKLSNGNQFGKRVFDMDSSRYLFMMSNKERKVRKDVHIQLVELSTVLE